MEPSKVGADQRSDRSARHDALVAKAGRNEPCACGSGRKAKRCCGVERGPSDESLARAFLSHASRGAAGELRHVADDEFDRLLDQLPELAELDLSLHAALPKLFSPTLDRFLDAFADDNPDDAEEPFAELLEAIDTPVERARLAHAVFTLRAGGRLDARLAAAALIDLASGSRVLLGASLVQAAAVQAGVARTPGGVLLAA
jgi:SEC-C motif